MEGSFGIVDYIYGFPWTLKNILKKKKLYVEFILVNVSTCIFGGSRIFNLFCEYFFIYCLVSKYPFGAHTGVQYREDQKHVKNEIIFFKVEISFVALRCAAFFRAFAYTSK